MKDYRGGILRLPSPDYGRSINLREKVVINETGKEGIVVELYEGSYVFDYYVRFPDDPPDFFGHHFETNEITPVENP